MTIKNMTKFSMIYDHYMLCNISDFIIFIFGLFGWCILILSAFDVLNFQSFNLFEKTSETNAMLCSFKYNVCLTPSNKNVPGGNDD